jgi:hypothetical protein
MGFSGLVQDRDWGGIVIGLIFIPVFTLIFPTTFREEYAKTYDKHWHPGVWKI